MTMSKWLGLLRSVDKKWSALETGLALVCGVGILFFLVFTMSEVLGRYFFNRPIPGHVELTELMAGGILLLAVAYSQMRGANVRVDIFLARLKGRLYHRYEAFLLTLSIIPIALFAVFGFKQAIFTYHTGWSTGILHLPIWPFMVLASIGFSMLLIRLIIQLIRHATTSGSQEGIQ